MNMWDIENDGENPEGVGVTHFKHFCKYSLVRRSIKDVGLFKKWIERCRCGRFVLVDCKLFVGGSNSPKVRKTWFDSEGNVSRITGTNNLDGE